MSKVVKRLLCTDPSRLQQGRGWRLLQDFLMTSCVLQAGQYGTFEFDGIEDSTLTRSWTLSCHPDETARTNTISITVKRVSTLCSIPWVYHVGTADRQASHCQGGLSRPHDVRVTDVAVQVGKASVWLWDNMGQLRTIAFRGLDGIFTSDVVPSEGEWRYSSGTRLNTIWRILIYTIYNSCCLESCLHSACVGKNALARLKVLHGV